MHRAFHHNHHNLKITKTKSAKGFMREGRNTNPAHKEMLLTYITKYLSLRKKNPHWDRKSVDDHGSTTRVLYTEASH